jgi:hypothetical protein
MKRLGAALCQWSSPGSKRRGPQAGSLDRPAAALAQAHALGDVNLRDAKVAWRAFFARSRRLSKRGAAAAGGARRRGASMGPGACVISHCLRAAEGRLLRSAHR